MNKVDILLLDFTLAGGVERFVANLSKELSGIDYDVNVYSMFKTHDKSIYDLPASIRIKYLTNIAFIAPWYKIFSFFAIAKYLIVKRSGVKIISTSPIITIIIGMLSRSSLACTVASEHSTYSAHIGLVSKLRLHYYKMLSSVVTQTKNGVDNFDAKGINAVKIENSVTEFDDNLQWANRINLVNSKFNILIVGRYDPVKQLHHAIYVANFLRGRVDFVLNIVGSGVKSGRLDDIVKQYDLENYVKLHEATSNINEYYAKCDIYIITSKSEAYPMTMLEAMSYGVCVISYKDLAGPSELIKDGKNGFLIEQDNYKLMANKIVDILTGGYDINPNRLAVIDSVSSLKSENIRKKWDAVLKL